MVTSSQTYEGQALLVEDDPFMRQAVYEFLSDLGFEVTAAATYTQAQAYLAESGQAFRFALVDLSLPRETDEDNERHASLGLKIVHDIKTDSPDTGVVVWSAYTHYLPDILALVTQGYRGLAYVPKGRRASALREAIARVLTGDVYFHHSAIGGQLSEIEDRFLKALPPDVADVVRNVMERLPNLPPRQRQVVEQMIYRPTTIAADLGLAERTVRNYQDAIYERLGLRDPLVGAQNLRRDPIIVLALILDRLRQLDVGEAG